jgi:hypothetical protein
VASFRYVVAGHRYWADVDAYEQPATALRAAGFGCDPSGASGSSNLCTPDESGKLVPVEPRWATTCGSSVQAVAKINADVKIGDCDPLDDDGTPGETAILVDPSSALGSLTCKSDDEEDGDVAALSILPEDGALPDVTGIPCGAEPSPYDEGIEPGQTYRFRIEAQAAEGGDVLWGSSCFVIPKVGIVNTATCDPLTNQGSLTVAFDGTVACPEGGTIEVSVKADSSGPEPEGPLATLDCGGPATLLGVLAGEYELDVTIFDAEHTEPGTTLTCSAVVPPAATGTTDCLVPNRR